ncbi:hypothetical protein G6F22_020121 [Rhizopus arrhizus]|nr:hypothetical protein G6F22_020121 [Rhizopus arrhizus]KAG1059812.1 hypothetical protein G6F40_018110 [Rhizopus arrhizus]KAG1166094.1 hypothetical protein G6F35_018398 [Rhizopus arrhizus]
MAEARRAGVRAWPAAQLCAPAQRGCEPAAGAGPGRPGGSAHPGQPYPYPACAPHCREPRPAHALCRHHRCPGRAGVVRHPWPLRR